jgi:superfamily II DNA or RNA helicase
MTYGHAKGLHICCRGGKSRVLRCAALGLAELDDLRPHQQDALDFVDVEAQPDTERRRSLLVFSGKPLLEQFQASELRDCGAEVFPVYSNAASVSAEAIAQKLKEEGDEPLLLLTTYASLPKVHEALRLARRDEPELCFTACCFDEAHNLHTASRRQLWGVEERVFEEEESGEEGEDEQMLDPHEFASMYPWRLYATATPRPQMRDHPEIYGDVDEDWFRYRYVDLLRDQDPSDPMVKPFDLSISVGGRPEQAEQSAEFFDWVAILREIAWQRDRVRRVMVYLSRAVEGEAQQTRSAEHFASAARRLWAAALAYLHGRGEALCLEEADLVVTHANGSMRAEEVRRVKDDFNAPTVDAKVHVLCSCQVFAEGVTLERVDLTVFADGKKSERDVVQSGMRGLKASAEGPEARLRILLLVHLDAVGLADARDAAEVSNRIAEALRSRKKMDRMAAVLAALKEEDESLAEELRELAMRVEKREGGGGGGGGRGGGGGGDSAGGGRFVVRFESELLIGWKTSEKEIADAAADVAASVIIELDRGRRSSAQMVKWKVRLLCAAWPDLEVPKRGEMRAAPPKLAADALDAGFILSMLDGGGYLNNICSNWTEKMPHVALEKAEKDMIENAPWFRAWQGGKYGLVAWKVRLLCAAWPSTEVPKWGEMRTAPFDLAVEALAAGFVLKQLDGGVFLLNMYHNWTDRRPHTFLKDTEKDQIESALWFRAWRAGRFGSVVWKVRLLCAAWPESVPKHGEVRVAPEVVAVAKDAGIGLEPLNGGVFLNKIFDNWTDKKPKTVLKDAEKAIIETMPWFLSWRGGMRAAVAWKVRLLCDAWTSMEVPKWGEVRAAPPDLAVEALSAGFALEPLNGGLFLASIKHNWTHEKPKTTLQDIEKEKIQAAPWFRAWRGGKRCSLVAWKVRLLCAAWPGLEVPKCGEVRAAPPELAAEALAAGFVLAPLDGRTFLNNVYHNWNDEKPQTILKKAEKERIQAALWFRAWREGRRGAVAWKARLLCAAWPGLEVPKQGDMRTAPLDFAAEALAAGFFLEPLDGGTFLLHIYRNWTDKKPLTALQDDEKAMIETLPWFPLWMIRRKRKQSIEAGATRLVRSRRTETETSETSEASPSPPTTSPPAASSASPGYDTSTFTAEHLAFKDDCTAIFVRAVLDFCDPGCNVAYLDDFDGTDAKDLRTTKALLAAGIARGRLYMANPDDAVCHKLKSYGAATNEARCTFEAALRDNWRSARFGALYLDLCTGSSEVVLENLAAALPALSRRCVVGFTFTRRDTAGETAMERQYKIEDDLLKQHGFERARYDGLRVFPPSGVYTQFYFRSS